MTLEELKTVELFTKIKVNTGYYKDQVGGFYGNTDSVVSIKIGDDVVLFSIFKYLKDLTIVE